MITKMCFEENKAVEKSENVEELVCSLFKLICSVGVKDTGIYGQMFGLKPEAFKPDMNCINIRFVNKMEHILERIKKTIVAEEVVNEKEIRELSERLEELNLQIREDGINAKPKDIEEMTNILKRIKDLKR